MRVLFICFLVAIGLVALFRNSSKKKVDVETSSDPDCKIDEPMPPVASRGLGDHLGKLNPHEYAPTYFDNANGLQPWSGKVETDLTALDAISILEFCESEGVRQGWNAEHRGDADSENRNPFNTKFLGGNPSRWWITSFETGRQMYRNNDTGWLDEQRD